MQQAPLPLEYTELGEDVLRARIQEAKRALGSRLVVLGHHYQRDEIVEHADFRGDSYKLSKDAQSHPEAEFIVFCGVHFMAESADILTPPHQKVILPNMSAGCSMADMANLFQVKACWRQLGEVLDVAKVVPVTYINSAANLKGFVGERDGYICTSSNAPKIVAKALEQGEKLLFFPDQHLGRNTGVKLGYDHEKDMVVWDPFRPLGGNTAERLREATFILWKGHCSVHQRFTVEQIALARQEDPGVRALVHPECTREVVEAADLNGSTEFIVHTVRAAPSGSSWAIGTEINLVSRLAKEMPDKRIQCLDPQVCPCSTMYRIHPSFLLWSLDHLVQGEVVNQVVVPEAVRKPALVALERMLAVA